MELIEFDKEIELIIDELKNNIKQYEYIKKDTKKSALEYRDYSLKLKEIIEENKNSILAMKNDNEYMKSIKEELVNQLLFLKDDISSISENIELMEEKKCEIDCSIEKFDEIIIEAEKDFKEAITKAQNLLDKINKQSEESKEVLSTLKKECNELKELHTKTLDSLTFINDDYRKIKKEYDDKILMFNEINDRINNKLNSYENKMKISFILSIIAAVVAVIGIIF